MTRDAVDLFAGPGGWDVAARRLGIDALGVEYDAAACDTRKAADLDTLQADVSALDPRDFPARGRIASPPCQGFSLAGKGQARRDSLRLIAALDRCRTASDVTALIADARGWMTHEGTALALEPLRWALACPSSWLAWEQVPAVLPLWEACARVLRRRGWSVATGMLHAEQYGVPQTRKRAILVARAPWLTAELGPVALPTPTHSRYHVRNPGKIDPGMPRWVSMAEALGWGPGGPDLVAQNGAGMLARGGRERTRRPADAPALTITGGSADNSGGGVRHRWEHPTGEPVDAFGDVANTHGAVRDLDTPAPTLTSSADNGNFRFVERDRVNNQSGTDYDVADQLAQPATTLAGRDLVGFRGPNANRFNGSTKSRNDGIRVTVEEAAILQSFPPDHPWWGTKTKRFQQVGNAIPPLLAEAILAVVAS